MTKPETAPDLTMPQRVDLLCEAIISIADVHLDLEIPTGEVVIALKVVEDYARDQKTRYLARLTWQEMEDALNA